MKLAALLQPLFPELDRPLRAEDSPTSVTGWDSLKQIEVILAVEEAFRIDLTTREVLGATSLTAIAGILRARGLEVEL